MTLGALVAGCRSLAGGSRARVRLTALLEQAYGARSVVLVDSGTTALTMALRWAARARPDCPVALPAYGCYDLATACDGADVRVALYDVDPTTLGPSWPSLRQVLAGDVAAVIIAHLYGVPCDIEAARNLGGAGEVPVIDDAAQGAGAAWGGRPLGAGGTLGVLSFGRGKGITGGGGGALLVGEAIVTEPPGNPGTGAMSLGKLAAQWALGRPTLYGLPSALPFLSLGETVYRRPHAGRMIAGSSAAVAVRTWPLQAPEAAVRRRNALRLSRAVPRGATVPAPGDEAQPGWLRLPVVLATPAADLLDRHARALGVAGGYPQALVDLSAFRRRVVNPDASFDGARALARRLVTLPTHSLLRPRDVDGLERWLAALAHG